MKFLFSGFLFFAVLFLNIWTASAREVTIRVAVTADVHARIFPYDFVENAPSQASMARVHSLMEAMRARYPGQVILLDNGDLIQGTPAAYYANFVQETDKNLFSRVLNFMKYDAATIGNHDIEAGPKVYNRLKEEFNFPWLGANVLDEESGEPYFKPYTIINRQQIRIAVLGLTTTGVPNWLPKHLWEGLVFEDMVASASHWVEYIRNNESVDAVVGLFHTGFGSMDPNPSSHPLENAAGYIARNVPGFDLIFTGHDHRQRVQTVENILGENVLVLGPGHFAENLAVGELTFRIVGRRNYELVGVEGVMIPLTHQAPSRSFAISFEEDVQEIITFSNRRVGRLTSSMNSMDALFGSAPFTDLVHEIQLGITGADVSFTAPLAFDQTIREGAMHMRDFFRLYEYENYLYTMELSGEEILKYLEFSYGLWLNTMTDETDHLLNLHQDALGRVPSDRRGRGALRNPPYNFDSAAGIVYQVDVSKPVGERVSIHGFEDGRPFGLDEVYRVAINSYRGSGGGGHLTQGAGISHEALSSRIVYTTDTDLRSKMIAYFQEKGEIIPRARGNWEVVPESWRTAGKRNDLPYLRP